MAVDDFHRLLVSGTPADVRAFRDAIYREYPLTIAGKTWMEIVPFSFAGLYELAPAARRIVLGLARRDRTP
jgi:hypothetical protein